MAPRKKPRTPRRSKRFSIFNALEGFAYLNLAMVNFAGNNPISFFTGKGGFGDVYDTGESLTLTSLLENPSEALAGVMMNVKSNGVNFLIQSVMLGVGFRLARRLTSPARSKINNYLLKPILGKGVGF